MFENLKNLLYFPIASYFKFFAKIRLQRWHPKIVVVTGSNGKTTLLHMLEAQLGEKAKFSHHANSAYGIPFDILDLHRKTLQRSEWFALFFSAPLNVFKPLPKENLYVVEADADRPNEGKFLAELLRPDVTLWVSTGRTHSMNFDHLVIPTEGRVEGSHTTDVLSKSEVKDSSASLGMTKEGAFKTVEEAIAYEYGYFLQYCKSFAVIDGDSSLEVAQTGRTKAKIAAITKKDYLKDYAVKENGTEFHMKDHEYLFKGLLPQEVFLSIAMCREAIDYLELPFDPSFKQFHMPPGRGTLFAGVKETTLIDSTYNGNLGSIKAMLAMFEEFPGKKKWVVIGDMKELGKEEKEEHEALAKVLNAMDLEQVILVGKLVQKYTLPLITTQVGGFNRASDAAEYLGTHIKGGEAILFKGSQSVYLEGLIEPLLLHKEDAARLPRQEQFWKSQRQKLGFV
jgi:UDP-N-acetylmuramyl pentapeptide synthase